MEYNSDFRYDLKLAEEEERFTAKLLSMPKFNAKIEVKNDKMYTKTGNIFCEFESRGKPSGISITEAEVYSLVLEGVDDIKLALLIQTEDLKKIMRKKYQEYGYVKGGDSNTSKGVLLNLVKNILKK